MDRGQGWGGGGGDTGENPTDRLEIQNRTDNQPNDNSWSQGKPRRKVSWENVAGSRSQTEKASTALFTGGMAQLGSRCYVTGAAEAEFSKKEI